MIYVKTDDTGRLTAIADPGFHCGPGEIQIDVPRDEISGSIKNYVWRDGHLSYEPEEPEPAAPAITISERFDQIETALFELAGMIGGML